MQKISKSWIIPSLLWPLWLSWHLQDLDLPRPNLSPKSSCESNSFLRNLVILAFAILATFGHFLLHTFLQLHVGFGWGLPNFLYYELNLIPRRPNLSPKSSMQCIACESNTEFGFFWILVSFSTLKLNDLIWAKNAKSWIPSSSSWGPINVAHLKNFGILDRHALQFLNVYSSVHPSIFKSYVFWVLQKLKWIWNLFVFW